MIFFVLLLLLLIFNKAEFCKPNEFNKNYASPDSTLAIKGIFVALILLSHGKGYIDLNSPYDAPYVAFQNHLNQMVVAMFLFYSGFGMMESIKKKQSAYITSLATKRFPNLFLNYSLAVLLYFVMDYCIGNPKTLKDLFIAIIGWNGIGNSSWYIFVIFVMYIATMIAFLPKYFSKNKFVEFISIVILSVLGVALILALKKAGKEGFWYNTIVLFVLGFWYSFFKDVIEKIVMKNDAVYLTCLGVIIVGYSYFTLHRWDRLLMFEIWAILFCALMIMLSMKITLQNEILKFLGKHIFSIYILQRIPMILLDHYGVSDRHKYIFIISSLAISVVMAVLYDNFTSKLSQLIWKPKKNIS